MRTADARQAVAEVFSLIDAERWDDLCERLAEDVQLSDELTGVWLRGRQRVAGYLQAQSGIVTELTSVTEEADVRTLAPGIFLVTFNINQRYLLAGTEHKESLTGTCIFSATENGWTLSLYQLGGQGQELIGATSSEEVAPFSNGDNAEDPLTRVSAAMRQARMARGHTLREIASEIGISAGHLSQLETGKREPSLTLLLRFSSAVGVSMRTLLEASTGQSEAVVSSLSQREQRGTSYQPGVRAVNISRSATWKNISIFELTIDPIAVGQDIPLETGEASLLYFEAGGADLILGNEIVSAKQGDIVSIDRQSGARLRSTGPGTHRILCIREES